MYIVFYSTSNVFKAESLLNKANIACNVVPTPATDKAYCGVCIEVENDVVLDILDSLEYELVMEGENKCANS
ncbi:MAG: DUF3343 domain-containing protein [Coprococcus sp.]|nr:DUF3343 domain-containing protein [Coprococcus sp.]